MSDDTPATRTDPATGTEGDSDQLSGEDTMSGGSSDELLDLGTSPPERPRSNHWGETAWEESHGEPMDLRLSEEEPEVWDQPEKGARQPDRAGRLVEDGDALDGHRGNDTFAEDVGIDGGAASAEEAAMRIVEDPRP
ncbi:DUF5709 domain-containing protein [Cellulomonas fimi]|uniref:DUF5709 domain-containing protein n=1 Tax=Cellulomonas fimi TaxID=1708 RepID=A0A7Y0LY62_CELFI|nr:DUF5709 domain-containing protein [Cellulomonas fimi]NMR18907.1 hypothetical protein [Cellulomonas fimi]